MKTLPIAVVIPPENFRDEELFEPLTVWEQAGLSWAIVSQKTGEIIGDLGATAEATALIDTLDPAAYAAICITGGSGTIPYLWEDAVLQQKIRDFTEAGKLAAGICAGSVVLARAGVLKGRVATTYPVSLMSEALQAAGVPYSANGLIDHGDVLTASGPDQAVDYARAIANRLLALARTRRYD